MLDTLISEMIARGVHYEDARREFDKRFVSSVIDKCEGNLCKAADSLGIHRNTLARKIKELKIKTRPTAS